MMNEINARQTRFFKHKNVYFIDLITLLKNNCMQKWNKKIAYIMSSSW